VTSKPPTKPVAFHRAASWLMPGLSLKRWLGIAVCGMMLCLLGGFLLLNFQPVNFIIGLVRDAAKIIPAHISGPILLLCGGSLFYFGFKRAFSTVRMAIHGEGANSGLLEALYRQNKLIHGPRIVVIGGGTGLSTLLRGLKHYTSNITAVVTVGDDGGSSGRLREEHNVIPPGDIRNCIAALADEEQLITELFQYRFKTGSGLEGHSFGNLFLTAMCHITGDMFTAIRESSKVLNISGRVLPSTLDHVTLSAEMSDGTVVVGESMIPEAKGKIHRLRCFPESPQTLPEVIDAIQCAELIILGPGSLYTSVLPNLLITEIVRSVSESPASKLYIANIMTQPGETDGYSVGDHIQAIIDHCPYPDLVNGVLVNKTLPLPLLEKYHAYGYKAVSLDRERCQELGIDISEQQLVDENEHDKVRHNPLLLGRAIIQWYKHRARKRPTPVLPPVVAPLPIDPDKEPELLP